MGSLWRKYRFTWAYGWFIQIFGLVCPSEPFRSAESIEQSRPIYETANVK